MSQGELRMKKIIFGLFIVVALVYYFKPKHENRIELNQNGTKILAFGDSLTYGTGVSKDKSYPAQLEKILHVKVLSSGIPGEVSESGLKRLPAVLDEVKPDILVLCHGGNDILRKLSRKQTKQNIEKMVELAQQKGISVVLVGVPNLSLFGISTADMYGDIAQKYKLPYEDEILEKIEKDVKLKSDQIHPNEKGYKMMAEAIAGVMRQNYNFASVD